MEHSHIVIGLDGTVLAATGPVAPRLVAKCLKDCDALPREIRDAGAALVHELRASCDRAVSRTLTQDGPARIVHLIAVQALAVRRAPTDLRALLTSKLDVISFQAAAADVTLRLETAADVPAALPLDAEKIAWVVTTLVGNALRYVRSGSRRRPAGTIDVKTTYDRATSEITVTVQDDGPGIPADTVSRLFKRDGLNVRGAGLALLLVSDIMAADGGGVDVRSSTDAAGHGTTIRLTFPMS